MKSVSYTHLDVYKRQILNKVCRPVTNFDDRLATLLDDMRETMIAADGGGLAGPQVGMLRRQMCIRDRVGRKLDFLTQELNRETNTIRCV